MNKIFIIGLIFAIVIGAMSIFFWEFSSNEATIMSMVSWIFMNQILEYKIYKNEK